MTTLNKNLTCTTDKTFRGYPIQTEKGSLVEHYLQKCYLTLQQALKAYPRTFALRVDLRIPAETTYVPHNVISEFSEQLNRIIARDRLRAKRSSKNARDSELRYVWVRERSTANQDHYHLVLFLNWDAYSSLGNRKATEGNMAARITKAWANALGLFFEDARDGVHFPKNSCYKVCADDRESQADLFYRMSYLCKPSTKQYNSGKRNFGCSRR